MGHESSTITERRYIHLFDRQRTDEAVRQAMASGALAGEREPLCSIGVGSNGVDPVACLDGIAIGADGIGLLPGGDAPTKDI
jgi:hypothetical protein